jgi:exodeoxyribonuclease VII large subunit
VKKQKAWALSFDHGSGFIMNGEFDFEAGAKAAVVVEKGGVEERDVYTPSRLNREARILLERGLGSLWLEGEISNFSRPSSGHWYFSLKDANAQLRSAMFRQRNLAVRFPVKDGVRVLARGRVSLYEARGDYQFIVDHLEEAGEGDLRRKFEELKVKLAAEGLFATERKQALPRLPKRIGVITSPTGAAIRDILHILERRFASIPVLIYPVPVQGAAAASKIAAAIDFANVHGACDVLLVTRGGGSLEDLWAFNEERVARAIVRSKIPIVSGIGHEIDFTIADFVADVRAPTPSGAAEIVVPDSREWLRALETTARRLASVTARHVSRKAERLAWTQRRLAQMHPGAQLRQRHQRLDELEDRMRRCLRAGLRERRALLNEQLAHLRRASPAVRIANVRARLEASFSKLGATATGVLQELRGRVGLESAKLNAVSPLATLARGYAIVVDAKGTVVTDSSAVKPGDELEARLSRGSLKARVIETHVRENKSPADET